MLLFGVIAAATVSQSINSSYPSPTPHVTIQRRLALIRLFSFLAVAVTVIVISSGLLRTVIHFMLKVWM